jgi:Ca2+-binding EF-hand superfamily protein
MRDTELDELSPNELDRAFEFYDTNRDGRISLIEANAGLQRGPEALAS